jgi:hypothetical protein
LKYEIVPFSKSNSFISHCIKEDENNVIRKLLLAENIITCEVLEGGVVIAGKRPLWSPLSLSSKIRAMEKMKERSDLD